MLGTGMSKAATGHLYRVYTRYVRCQNAVDPACMILVLSASHTASRTSCLLWYHALDHSVMTYLRHFHHTCRHWSAAARSCLVAMSCIQTSISPEASCAGGAYSHVQRVGDEGGGIPAPPRLMLKWLNHCNTADKVAIIFSIIRGV